MEKSLTVTVKIDGLEDFVRAELRKVISATQDDPAATIRNDKSQTQLTERELIAEKRPKNQTEKVAVLAFCLTENGQPEFTEADVRRAYVRAGIRPPKVISQALRDAKNKFDLIEGGKKRGTFRLSAHGDRTVRFDLPTTS